MAFTEPMYRNELNISHLPIMASDADVPDTTVVVICESDKSRGGKWHWCAWQSSGGKWWILSDNPVVASDVGVFDKPVVASDAGVFDKPVVASDAGVSDNPVVASDAGVSDNLEVASDAVSS